MAIPGRRIGDRRAGAPTLSIGTSGPCTPPAQRLVCPIAAKGSGSTQCVGSTALRARGPLASVCVCVGRGTFERRGLAPCMRRNPKTNHETVRQVTSHKQTNSEAGDLTSQRNVAKQQTTGKGLSATSGKTGHFTGCTNWHHAATHDPNSSTTTTNK